MEWGEFTVDVAAPEDVSAFLRLRDEAAQWLSSRGINQWKPREFAASWLDKLIAQEWVFLLRHGEELAATVTVLWDDPFVWGEQEVAAGYIHNLIVARSFAGQGLGRRLLQWAEDHVAASGRSLARLDCVSSNGELRHRYESAG
ncbi:MAG TPA: GNAT family N-acetyltransferase [Acidimicrobiales bacterium]|nr:GNAT family N-acetyltransferase [Acidimicrobiales bacterium]